MGGSRESNCSILEAIDIIHEISGKKVNYTLKDENRIGDHIWWISDVRKFQEHYPNWKYQYGIKDIIKEIVEATLDRGN